MVVREKDPTRAEAPMPENAGWLQRIDEFGQKHARIILTVCAGVIVITVLVIANFAFRSSEADRVSRAISNAQSATQLRKVKSEYASSSHLALILATLGNKLAQDGQLAAAQREYDEFLERFPDHPLKEAVQNARKSVAENLVFENEQKEALIKLDTLESHPVRSARLRDSVADLRRQAEAARLEPDGKAKAEAIERQVDRIMSSPLGMGPVKERHPLLVVKLKDKNGQPKASLTIELFEDEAPNTVANLVQLAESGAFKGAKIAKTDAGEDSRLQVTGTKPDYAVPFEATTREGLVGSLVLVRQGDHNAAGEFQILLKSADLPKDVTVCGIIGSPVELEAARLLTADDTIDTVTVDQKRPHEYKPQTVKP